MAEQIKYASVFRYDHGEEFNIYNIYKSFEEAKKGWKKDVKDFLSYGPDDASTLYLFELALSTSEMNQFKQHLKAFETEDEYSYDSKFTEFMEALYQNEGFKQITHMTCDGNYDIIKLAKQDGIGENKLFNDSKLYNKYLNKYIRKEICL